MRFDLLNPTLWRFTTITLGLTVVTLLSIHNAWTWQQIVAGVSLIYSFWYLLIRPLLFSLLQ
ncbi:MAG: hypothetical protein QG626_639, partial [Patescibacteria group bacterium]|nr:hypothetical protein [Patescibacteria group bacterium]